ncbi:MAG: hypothetical protein KBD76_09055 [Bacteriovorax sp.]|nr:hypothetical protein [Bacteriovorax sp.]
MKCFFSFAFILFSFMAKAITFEDAVFPELATSARALAMGNAFISKVDDASAVFYNPAGLGTVRYPHMHLSNFQLEINKGFLSSSTSGTMSEAVGNFSKAFSLEGTRQLLLQSPGTYSHSSFHALPNFTSRYFSFGYLLSQKTRATVTDTTSATGFEFADRLDHGPYAALNISLFGGIIKAGASVIVLQRKELITSVDPNTALALETDDYQKGRMVNMTGGGKITLPFTFLPTLSMTIHNALDNEFYAGSGLGTPAKITKTYDVGFSLTPQIGTSSRIHLEVNYKDMGGAYKTVSTARKILVGAELDFSRVFFFRLGYGDGFGSAGLGIKSRKLEFDLTTYAVDTTTSSFRGQEDRRFALSISSGF